MDNDLSELMSIMRQAVKEQPRAALDIIDALVSALPLYALVGVVERRIHESARHIRTSRFLRELTRDGCEQFITHLRNRFPSGCIEHSSDAFFPLSMHEE